MRRPIVPDALLTRGRAKANPIKVSHTEPVSRDKRFDNPCCLVGYSRNMAWEFRQTAQDDKQRAIYINSLIAKYHH